MLGAIYSKIDKKTKERKLDSGKRKKLYFFFLVRFYTTVNGNVMLVYKQFWSLQQFQSLYFSNCLEHLRIGVKNRNIQSKKFEVKLKL